jgi:hypothetical protein
MAEQLRYLRSRTQVRNVSVQIVPNGMFGARKPPGRPHDGPVASAQRF